MLVGNLPPASVLHRSLDEVYEAIPVPPLLATPMSAVSVYDPPARAASKIPPPPPAPPARVPCSVCFETRSPFTMRFLPGCRTVMCRTCHSNWVASQVHSGACDLQCVNRNCKNHIIPIDASELPPKLKERLETNSLNRALTAMPDFRWCVGCSFGGFIDPSMANGTCSRVQCRACTFSYCLHCQALAHDGVTCEQAKMDPNRVRQRHEEEASKKWKHENSKPCPKCQVPIQRNGGCSHMTCNKCRHQWCWICARDYKGSHVPNDATTCKCG